MSGPENNFSKILKEHLLYLLDYQKHYWKKGCTVRWSKFSDENANVFQRLHKNYTSKLTIYDDSVLTEHADKKNCLLHSRRDWDPAMTPHAFGFALLD